MDIASIAVAIGDGALRSSPAGEKVISRIKDIVGQGTTLPDTLTGKEFLLWMDALPDALHDKIAEITIDVQASELKTDDSVFPEPSAFSKRSLRQYLAIGIAVLVGLVVVTISFVAIHSSISGDASPDSSGLIKLVETLLHALDGLL